MCRARLEMLDLERASNVRELCVQLGQKRGQPIHLLAIELDSARPSGLWIAMDGMDFIVFEANTSAPHQEHIIAHELAHIILGHRNAELNDVSARLLFPKLDPGLVRDMLSRTGYADESEQEAEMLATLMLQRIGPVQGGPVEHTAEVRRIKDSLG